MGILNITPDSFSGDGLISKPAAGLPGNKILDLALEQAGRFLGAGADILDVGAESTRPGAPSVSAAEELDRLMPVLQALVREYPAAVISIDTYKSEVAAAALESGAGMINDVWGLNADPLLAQVIARFEVPLILMHNRSKPGSTRVQAVLGGRYVGMEYANLLEDVRQELMASVKKAQAAGISQDKIILDPGIGFGKTTAQNLELINRLDEIRALGFPVLLGPSRKSFIGYTLNLPPQNRLEGTAAAVSIGIARGADIIRVHDVEAMVRVARMTDAIVRPLK